MLDHPSGSARGTAPVLRTGAFLTFDGEAGHAWFARSPRPDVPRRPETLPALRAAERMLARQERTVGRRAVRIPDDAFVSIASRALPAPPRVLQLSAPAAEAEAEAVAAAPASADRAAAAAAPVRRPVLRTVFFLLVFLTTIVLAYWSGRMRGYENVIVVPAPWDDRATVT